MKRFRVIALFAVALIFVTAQVHAIGVGAALAITSTVVGLAQGIVAGKANEKAAIAQQKTFDAMFLGIQEVNVKIDGVLDELYQIADEIETLPKRNTQVLLSTQLTGTALLVSSELLSFTQNSLNYTSDDINLARLDLRSLRLDLGQLISQAKSLESAERRAIYGNIALAEEIYLATYLAEDFLASATYLQQARSGPGPKNLENCDSELLEDLRRLGMSDDEIEANITCSESEARSNAMMQVRDLKELEFNSFWSAEISEDSVLSQDVRVHFPGANVPMIYQQSRAGLVPQVAGTNTIPTIPDGLSFPNLVFRPGTGATPSISTRSLVANHLSEFAPGVLDVDVPRESRSCGVLIPWVSTFDLSSRAGWNTLNSHPKIANPIGIGWAIGDLVEDDPFTSFLLHENYQTWFKPNWIKSLSPLDIYDQPLGNPTVLGAGVTWKPSASHGGRPWPSLEISIPECSGLPVYVTYYRVRFPLDSMDVDSLCQSYGVDKWTIERGHCPRDYIFREHEFGHPMNSRDAWLRMMQDYDLILGRQTKKAISDGNLVELLDRQVSNSGSIANGWAFPFSYSGPYFSDVVGKWKEILANETGQINSAHTQAITAMSDVSAYLAAEQVLHQRKVRSSE